MTSRSRRARKPKTSTSTPTGRAPARARRGTVAPAGAPLSEDLRALRLEVERTAGQVKDAIQKIERLTLAVGELQDDVAELRASLGEGEVEYGSVDGEDSEVGEGHA